MSQELPILVVEDDPNLREAICDTLMLAGKTVLSAPGGGGVGDDRRAIGGDRRQ